ncbi:MAG: ABC transporter permease, partial [Oscillospiraceae bacterium]
VFSLIASKNPALWEKMQTNMLGKAVSMVFTWNFFASVVRMTTPILFAALGAIICKRAGILNMTLEGCMNITALAGVLFSGWTRAAIIGTQTAGTIGEEAFASLVTRANTLACIVGVLSAVVIGVMLELLYALMTVQFRSNFALTGIAINMMVAGLAPFVCQIIVGTKAGTTGWLTSGSIPNVDIPLIKDIPILGSIISGHSLLTYFCIICIVLVNLLIYRTRTGLRIRAVGENAHAAESVGVNVKKVQFQSIVLTGVFCSFGGVFLSMSYVNFFVKNMAADRGFIGLSASNLGNGIPIMTTLAAVVFGFFDALAVNIRTLDLPTEFVAMLPYLATLFGLWFYATNTDRKIKKARSQR